MKHRNIYLSVTALAGLFAVFATAHAQITVVDFGESSTYVTSNQALTGGNGSFSTLNISPTSNYTGPAFHGGVVYNVGGTAGFAWEVRNNDSETDGFDSIRGGRYGLSDGDSATYAFMFDGSQTFQIDHTADSSFLLKARRVGGSNVTGVTGIRWMLRDTDGDYFISELNSSGAAQFGGTYTANSAVSETGLWDLDWFEYTFTSGVIGAAVADTSLFFLNTDFDGAGFHYTAQRSGNGGLDMAFADFTVVAIPEPSTLALLGIAGLSAGLFARRRRGR